MQKPIGVIALLDEAWYNPSHLMSHNSIFSLCADLSLFVLYSACFLDQLMSHFQWSCSTTVKLILDWRSQNFQRRTLLSLIMLARQVVSRTKLNVILCPSNLNEFIHFILQVTYQTETFLDKNRDYAIVEHCNLLSSSKCPFVAGLFPSAPEESTRSSYKFSSVSSRFKVRKLPSYLFFTLQDTLLW